MNWVGVLGYGAAAVAFAVLAAILQAGWRGRGPGIRLIAAVAANAVWAGFMAREYWTGPAPILPHLLVEGGRAAAWVFVLGGLATSGGAPRRYVTATYLLCGAGLLVTVLTGLWEGFGIAMGEPGHATAVADVAFPIAVLILLEQIYRNSHASGRRAFRPLMVGVGGLFAFDLFMYGEGLMNVTVGVHTLELRALVNLVCVPAIALAARRNPLWSLDVFVSRQMAFYSTMLLSVGLYFLAMAAGGYVLGALGVEWGRAAQVAFMGGAGVVLAILVASGSVRARIRVFLSKHFYSNKYDYRVEWLRFVNTLESGAPEAEALPAMIRAVAQIIGSRFGALWIRTDEGRRLLLAGQWSADGGRTRAFAAVDAAGEFVEFVERRHWIVDLAEHRRAPETYQNLRLPQSLAVSQDLALLVPLIHAGRLVGLLGLGAPSEPFEMSFEDRDLLKTVGLHIGTHLAQLEMDRSLAESRQFEAYNRLTAFLMHDLKNLVAQLSLVVSNAEKHRRNPAFVDDAIDTIRNSTDRMGRLIEQLQRGEQRAADRPVPLLPLLERVIERTRDHAPVPVLVTGAEDIVVTADPDRLTMVIEHAVRNAQDATPPTGSVSLRLSRQGSKAVIGVADTGLGMSAEFVRDRLFKPFDSTKGSKGMGIGAYQVRDYVHSLGGDVFVSSVPAAGTVFEMSMPIADAVGSSEP